MVNPLNFFWREDMALHDLPWLGFVHRPKGYRDQVLPAKFWRKLLTGQVDLPRLLKLYAQHLWVLLGSSFRNTARALHIPLSHDLGYEMQAVAARGTEMVFLFSLGEAGIDILRHQGGSSVKQLGAYCRIHSIADADHIFSQGRARAKLEGILSEELFARHLPLKRGVEGIPGPAPTLMGTKR